MPIHGYPGGVITANPTAPTVSSASGVWTTEQQLQAVSQGNWPGYEYPISNSLRFNSADSAYLNRTPASAGSQTTWTLSGWVKRSALGSQQSFLSADRAASSEGSGNFFTSSDTLQVYAWNGSAYIYNYITTQVFRDVSSWYHIVITLDTTNATSADRVRIYVNGSRITTFGTSTAPSQNATGYINATQAHALGRSNYNTSFYLNGYLTEINFIDGQALTPSSFGQTNASTGVWEPINYTGTYGTNGFYVNFSDNSNTTAATLGKDYSGNGNNWTPNNFSVTAGAGNDSMVDSPTSYGTDTGVGGEVRGNYATLNPLAVGPYASLSNGNLRITATSSSNSSFSYSTIAVTSGKWYYEVNNTGSGYDASHFAYIGVATKLDSTSLLQEAFADYRTSGDTYGTGGSVGGRTVWTTTGDIVACAIDADNGAIYFRDKNGTWVNSGVPTSGASRTGAITTFTAGSKTLYGGAGAYQNSSQFVDVNFGQRPFAYSVPSGFKALCTQNLPTPTIGATSTTQANDYFNAVTYTGNGTSLSVTGVGFQPDLIWIKDRSNARAHVLQNAIAGFSQYLQSNATDAETTASSGVTAVGSDGFTVGTQLAWNSNTETYVAWNWNAGGSTVTNTSGTISAQVRANTTSGFSIATYTGTGSNATVGHGLGVAPSMIIIKRTNSTNSWQVYHSNANASPASGGLFLNTTDAFTTLSTTWNNTVPASTVFSIGTAAGTNASGGTYVSYCFAPVAGYSAFGSYTGNGSTDGPFVYTGFRPRYFMAKRTDAAGNSWILLDTARNTYNAVDAFLSADLSNAEATSYPVDFVSNGFKIRATTSNLNTNGGTYIYACFAESPFKYSLAR